MKSVIRVARPPPKPVMIFDGECNFCRLWIHRWQRATGDQIEYAPFQDPRVTAQFPELPRARCEAAVQLVEGDGGVHEGAEAVFRALARHPSRRWPLRWYESSLTFANLAERCYRFVAEHRRLFSALTRVGWGRHVERPTHVLVRPVFVRAVGIIYLFAFVSLWVQARGLIGRNGILPAEELMTAATEQLDWAHYGLDRYRLLPTLCWFGSSDGFLQAQCAAGAGLALLTVIGIAPGPCLALLWLLYLSLVTVSRDFLEFQWDNLLLETGLLTVFLAPRQLWPFGRARAPSRVVLWLLRWLLFRLMFESGCVKLLSGDPLWRNLTALTVHYETQPLPTWMGWYAHQLPLWAQKISCAAMFGVELLAPFLIFAPRRLRLAGGAGMAGLQVLIMLTGNYCFFNWLTLVLCVLLLDDIAIGRMLPRRWLTGWWTDPAGAVAGQRGQGVRTIQGVLAGVILAVSLSQLAAMFRAPVSWRRPLYTLQEWVAPFRSVNSYGLFAVMTASRPEIVVEGSDDAKTWRAYAFKYKPGDPARRPAFVAPHQPRLDWQMWFAALGTYRQNPWFARFCVRLLEGSPEVLGLLAYNPFPRKPPRYIRSVVYDYRFTEFATRRATGAYWRRQWQQEYSPVHSLPASGNSEGRASPAPLAGP